MVAKHSAHDPGCSSNRACNSAARVSQPPLSAQQPALQVQPPLRHSPSLPPHLCGKLCCRNSKNLGTYPSRVLLEDPPPEVTLPPRVNTLTGCPANSFCASRCNCTPLPQ